MYTSFVYISFSSRFNLLLYLSLGKSESFVLLDHKNGKPDRNIHTVYCLPRELYEFFQDDIPLYGDSPLQIDIDRTLRVTRVVVASTALFGGYESRGQKLGNNMQVKTLDTINVPDVWLELGKLSGSHEFIQEHSGSGGYREPSWKEVPRYALPVHK